MQIDKTPGCLTVFLHLHCLYLHNFHIYVVIVSYTFPICNLSIASTFSNIARSPIFCFRLNFRDILLNGAAVLSILVNSFRTLQEIFLMQHVEARIWIEETLRKMRFINKIRPSAVMKYLKLVLMKWEKYEAKHIRKLKKVLVHSNAREFLWIW